MQPVFCLCIWDTTVSCFFPFAFSSSSPSHTWSASHSSHSSVLCTFFPCTPFSFFHLLHFLAQFSYHSQVFLLPILAQFPLLLQLCHRPPAPLLSSYLFPARAWHLFSVISSLFHSHSLSQHDNLIRAWCLSLSQGLLLAHTHTYIEKQITSYPGGEPPTGSYYITRRLYPEYKTKKWKSCWESERSDLFIGLDLIYVVVALGLLPYVGFYSPSVQWQRYSSCINPHSPY